MILVTGAGGFIGRHLVEHFKSIGLNVVPLYHGSEVKILHNRWEADLSRIEHIQKLREVAQIPHTIIHLAGHIDISLKTNPASPLMPPIPGKEDIPELYLSNVLATANILDYCLHKGVKRIIYASSQAVYGIPTDEILTEESACIPLEHYAVSKLCGEYLLKVGARQGVAVVVLRFPGLYGENRTEGIVYKFFLSALQIGRINVDIDIPLPLDVIHINDVINAFEKAVHYRGENWICLNIATGEPCSLNLLADSIAELIPGCKVEHAAIPQPVVCMDSSKARAVLNWQAVPRRERLSSTIKKYIEVLSTKE